MLSVYVSPPVSSFSFSLFHPFSQISVSSFSLSISLLIPLPSDSSSQPPLKLLSSDSHIAKFNKDLSFLLFSCTLLCLWHYYWLFSFSNPLITSLSSAVSLCVFVCSPIIPLLLKPGAVSWSHYSSLLFLDYRICSVRFDHYSMIILQSTS